MEIMSKYKKPIVMLAMRLWKFITKDVPVDIEYRKLERLKMIWRARMLKSTELQDIALKLANKSAEIYAYCMRVLEKENEALKEKLSLMEQKNNG